MHLCVCVCGRGSESNESISGKDLIGAEIQYGTMELE